MFIIPRTAFAFGLKQTAAKNKLRGCYVKTAPLLFLKVKAAAVIRFFHLVIAVRVSGGHLCEAEAPTEPAGETAVRRVAIRFPFQKNKVFLRSCRAGTRVLHLIEPNRPIKGNFNRRFTSSKLAIRKVLLRFVERARRKNCTFSGAEQFCRK